MQHKTVTVTVDEAGQTTTDFGAFVGATCLDESQRMKTLLADLGVEVAQTSFTPKPELQAARLHVSERVEAESVVETQQQYMREG